jgi:DnaJ-class molecular chaperone
MIDFAKYKTYNTMNGFGSADDWNRNFNQRMNFEDANLILNGRDAYEILNVSQSDSLESIKKAYRQLALKNHPDRGGNTKIMQDIIAAYTFIMKVRL